MSARMEVESATIRLMVDDSDAVYPIEVDQVLTTPALIVEGVRG